MMRESCGDCRTLYGCNIILPYSYVSFIATSVPPADVDLKHHNVQVDVPPSICEAT